MDGAGRLLKVLSWIGGASITTRPSIEIVPDRLCVETKSLKQYFWSYRNEGAFHEKVTNTIVDDIVKAIAPRFVRLDADWFVRGGIRTFVTAEHRAKGWKPAPPVEMGASFPTENGMLG